MPTLVFICLLIVCILILVFISYSQKIAKRYDQVLIMHSLIYKAIKTFSTYLKDNYPDLDTFIYLDNVNDYDNLKNKIEDIFNYDFDDESNNLKQDIMMSLINYQNTYHQYESIITKYPKINKILNYYSYHDYQDIIDYITSNSNKRL